MGTLCGSTKNSNKNDSPKNNIKKDTEPTPHKFIKQNTIVPFNQSEKESIFKDLENASDESSLSDRLQHINQVFVRRISNLDVNLIYLIKNLPVEAKGGKSNDDLYKEWDTDVCRAQYKNELKEQSKTQKLNNLENLEDLEQYRAEVFEGLGLKNTKANLKQLSNYKDQMVFQILISISALFDELHRKFKNEHYDSLTIDKIKKSLISLQESFFNIYELDAKEELERAYFGYMKEELKVFNHFHITDNDSRDVSVQYTEQK